MIFFSPCFKQVPLFGFSGFIYRNMFSQGRGSTSLLISLSYNSLEAIEEGISGHNSKSKNQASQ